MASLLRIMGVGEKESGGRGPLNSNDLRASSLSPVGRHTKGSARLRGESASCLGPVEGKQYLSLNMAPEANLPVPEWAPTDWGGTRWYNPETEGHPQDPQAPICHASNSQESPLKVGGRARNTKTPRYNIGQKSSPYDVIVQPSVNL